MKRLIVALLVGFIFFGDSLQTIAEEQIPIEEQIELEDEMYQLEMLAIACYAEAGNQGFTGMQAVAGVILNRVDSTAFPNTVEAVLKQKNQFSIMSDGAYEKACWNVTQEAYDAVATELYERRYKDALYFRTGHYHKGRTPLYKINAHYFSR